MLSNSNKCTIANSIEIPLAMSLVNCPGMSPSCIVESLVSTPGEGGDPTGCCSVPCFTKALMGVLSIAFISQIQVLIEPPSVMSCKQVHLIITYTSL